MGVRYAALVRIARQGLVIWALSGQGVPEVLDLDGAVVATRVRLRLVPHRCLARSNHRHGSENRRKQRGPRLVSDRVPTATWTTTRRGEVELAQLRS